MRRRLMRAAFLMLFAAPAFCRGDDFPRASDPVVINGDRLPFMRGVLIPQLALYSCRGGRLTPVPFQIDERDARGRLTLVGPSGGIAHADDGAFDDNDELVFMSRDCGDRAPKDALPSRARVTAEISCTDPLTKAAGWVYLVALPGPAPYGGGRYVDYDPARDYVAAGLYEIGYTPGEMKSYFSTMIFKNGKTGRSPNVLDRFKFRIKMHLFFSLVTLSKTEDDMKSVLAGFKNGPVRAIRECNNSMYLVLGISSPSSTIDNFYYRDSIEWPTLINLPFNVSTIATEAFLASGCDWNADANGMGFMNQRNLSPVRVDGFMSEPEKRMDRREYIWSALSGQQGSFVSRLWLSPSLVMKEELLYVDDKNAKDDPEESKGHWGYNGYRFNITTVSKGTHRFVSYFYFPERWEPGCEKGFLDIIDHPLAVEARRM